MTKDSTIHVLLVVIWWLILYYIVLPTKDRETNSIPTWPPGRMMRYPMPFADSLPWPPHVHVAPQVIMTLSNSCLTACSTLESLTTSLIQESCLSPPLPGSLKPLPWKVVLAKRKATWAIIDKLTKEQAGRQKPRSKSSLFFFFYRNLTLDIELYWSYLCWLRIFFSKLLPLFQWCYTRTLSCLCRWMIFTLQRMRKSPIKWIQVCTWVDVITFGFCLGRALYYSLNMDYIPFPGCNSIVTSYIWPFLP